MCFAYTKMGVYKGSQLHGPGGVLGVPPSRGYPSSIYPWVLADPLLLGITLLPLEARVDTLPKWACCGKYLILGG